ncbi:MAG: hypothetical protein IKC10_05765 [Alphaproteobacteria bacterium]|nr:hypothetical protein [Alphaproteobacteria bacterium]
MKKIVFSGASGNGISPLEQIMVLKGYSVYGTDYSFDIGKDAKRKQALADAGIKIVPQDGSAITDDVEFLCVSAAIKDSNPDVKKAKEKNIPIKFRSDLLKDIFSQYPYGIAVGGTAGKTTTTAMMGYVLQTLNRKPCMINGGALCNFQNQKGIPNYIYNEGDICVIEADESDGSITKYQPFVGIINNISHDHTSMEQLMEYFASFATNSKNIVINLDCPNASKITHTSYKTFSTKDPKADFYVSNIKATPTGVEYVFQGKTFHLQMLGAFNVSNALATISACSFLGIDPLICAKTLEGFLGIKTRLEKIGTKNNITIYNDFAHNPSKIRASLEALKSYDGRIIAMYQPHTPFSAINTGSEMAQEIADILEESDVMILQEIYELTKDDIGITSDNIVKEIVNNGHKNAFFLPTKADTKNYIINNAKSGDRIIIMGAHDNSLADFCKELLEAI